LKAEGRGDQKEKKLFQFLPDLFLLDIGRTDLFLPNPVSICFQGKDCAGNRLSLVMWKFAQTDRLPLGKSFFP
jgi:hypothetical protein